ncbi:hypothetical protein [Pseudoalteromonas luteoviolacea]|uniref:hypothetical protein n=1 Tax=Pseudoalteromonas luteoviolacea TaxID=43657 RepID=UPI001B361975|nr:hypothetical protein [Pseudoalteromonas luteoviolacea]MBQ4834798.1 hypothetical protein [Pseudoalteromonas luteoviolacea]
MKNIGIPHQYACFECRKSFKRKQFSATYNRFMTRAQQSAQSNEVAAFNRTREYKCPDCGSLAHFMGVDFKAPKKTDIKSWREVQQRIESGKTFTRGT